MIGVGISTPQVAVRKRRGLPAMPSLPMPTGAKVMIGGHSFAANNASTNSYDTINPPIQIVFNELRGNSGWIRGLDNRFNLDFWADYSTPYPNAGNPLTGGINGALQGCGGDAIQPLHVPSGQYGIATRLPYMLARGPDLLILWAGTNDWRVYPGMTCATMITLVTPMLDACRAAGVWLIMPTITPMGASEIPDGDPRLAEMDLFNTWLVAQGALRTGLKVYDTRTRFGLASGRPDVDYFHDLLHFSDKGAYYCTLDLLDIMRPMVTDGDFRSRDNTVSNLYPSNGALLGTAGSVANMVGPIATGHAANKPSGDGTVVPSKEVVSGSLEKQVFTCTPGTTVTRVTFNYSGNVQFSGIGLAVGDWIIGRQFVELNNWAGWIHANGRLEVGSSSANLFSAYPPRARSTTAANLPQETLGYWLETNPFQIPSGCDRIRPPAGAGLDLRFAGNVPGTGIAKVSQMQWKKISDPRPPWGFSV